MPVDNLIREKMSETRYKTHFSRIFKHNNLLWQKILLIDNRYGISIGEINVSLSDILHDYGINKVKRKLRKWKYKILKEYRYLND